MPHKVDCAEMLRLLDEIGQCLSFQMSPVDFLLPVLGRFIRGESDVEGFLREYVEKTKAALNTFNCLPEEDIAESRRIFLLELKFADDVRDAILAVQNPLEPEGLEELLERLWWSMKLYLDANKRRGDAQN